MDNDDFDDLGEEEEEVEEEELDPNNPDHAFLILEREFTRTVAEIEQNPAISSYAEDYSKLFEALYRTNETRKELVDNVQNLDEQVFDTNERLDAALKLAEADAQTIHQLKSKIDHAWRMADSAHEREQQAQEIIDNLRKQIAELTNELNIKNKMSGDDEGGAAGSDQEALQRERDKLLGEVSQLQQKLSNAIGYQEELERKNSLADMRINQIAGQLEEQIGDLEITRKQKENLEGDIKDLNSETTRLNREIIQINNIVQKNEKIIQRLERNLADQKMLKEKLGKDLETLNAKHSTLNEDFNALSNSNEETKKELQKKNVELKQKENEGNKMKTEISKFAKIRENYDKKMRLIESDKSAITEDRDKMRQLFSNMEKELDGYKKQSNADKRTIDGMNREKDLVSKNMMRQQALLKDHVKLFKIQEQAKQKLQNEIDEYIVETGKQRKQVSYLEKERDRMVEEQLDLAQKIEDQLDEIKLKKSEVYDLKKNVAENETRLRMQQSLFETVRAERNGLQKALQESASECSELKSKLKVSSHQSEQLKEDIAAKEQQLIKEENVLRKLTKEKDNLRVELDNAYETIKQLKATVAEMNDEEKRLHKVILTSDRTIRQQAKDLEQLMNERDVLGAQLVRRNDELTLLYEKIKILQTTLNRGEAHYERRLEDIRLLKMEVRRLRQEKGLLSKSVVDMTDLRQEIFHLERDLTRERLKSRALEEEVQNPLNVHRWRKLEGSDPDMMELLRKVKLLQKRLLQKASEAVERERQLKEAELLYVNLRQVLARQPGPEVQGELVRTQKALTIRGNKMKCLVSELNMTEQQAIEYRENLDKVQEELKELKKKYMAEKKAQQKHMEMCRLTAAGDACRPGDGIQPVKFTGGGFRMSGANVQN